MEDKTEDKRSTWAKYGIPTIVGVGVALGAAVTVLSMLSGSENEDKTEDKRSTWAKYGIPTIVGVGVALGAAVTVLSMLSGSKNKDGEEKTMRAPGRPGVDISRNKFVKDPSSYFRDLRKK